MIDPGRYYRKGEVLEAPDGPGHVQLRIGRIGWRWRRSIKGKVFGPWAFAWTYQRALQAIERSAVTRIEVIE